MDTTFYHSLINSLDIRGETKIGTVTAQCTIKKVVAQLVNYYYG